MKLAQRMVLGYYKSKFQFISMFSPKLAAAKAFELFCTPYSKRRKVEMPAIFKTAELLHMHLEGQHLKGFRWIIPTNKTAKTIMICHGFDSYSYKFEQYIEPLLQAGFNVLAFDAPAHGLSSGKTINLANYRQMILEIIKSYGPVHGILAHSFGGVAAALALEQLPDHVHMRLVLVAPATETTTAIKTFFNYVPVSNKVKDEFEKLITKLGGHPSSWFSVSRVVQNITTPTLWVHDEDDTITPFADMQHLIVIQPGHVRFHITRGLGHSNVYKDDPTSKLIIDFFAALQLSADNKPATSIT